MHLDHTKTIITPTCGKLFSKKLTFHDKRVRDCWPGQVGRKMGVSGWKLLQVNIKVRGILG